MRANAWSRFLSTIGTWRSNAMTCEESRELILQLGRGERTAEEGRRLRQHLKDCMACAAFAQEAAMIGANLTALRSHKPVLSDPEALTTGILNAIGLQVQRAGRPRVSQRILDFVSSRWVKLGYVALVFAAVGLFVSQQLSTAAALRSLEAAMDGRRSSRGGVQVKYSVPSKLVHTLAPSPQLSALLQEKGAEERNGLIEIDRNAIQPVLEILEKTMFRSLNFPPHDFSRRGIEKIVETLQNSTQVNVTISSKERS